VPTGEEIAFDTKIRFVYDSVDDRLLFSQEFDGEGERWGSLDAMSPDELQTWVKDNLKQMTPEKLGWSNSDELPIWAISGFRNFGMG
jgi:hypothetical protein